MNNDSMLQKEFRERDVQRMRNIITKNYGDKTATQIGYTKTQVNHKEGDIWEENNKTWTIKNGIKMTVSKLDLLKKSLSLPISCPSCGQAMKDYPANRKMWSVHKKCLDCVLKIETDLKRLNKFEEYQRNMNIQSMNAYIKDLEDLLLEISITNMNDEYIMTEQGDAEKWSSNFDKQKLMQDLQEHIQKVKDIANS